MSETTFDATKLRDALVNVEPHAEHGGTLPVLGAVRFECDGSTLTLVATDRYVMAVETVATVEAGDEFTALVSLDDAARITALTKGAPKNVTYWPTTIKLDGDQLTVTVPGQTMTCQAVLGDFPRWRTIFEGTHEAATDPARSIEHTAYDSRLLAKFAKVTANGRKGQVMRLHFSDPNKPALVEIGETFRAVLMPCRVDWSPPVVRLADTGSASLLLLAGFVPILLVVVFLAHLLGAISGTVQA